jgi:hypothetical protein
MLNSGVGIVTVCELLQITRISPFSVFEVLLPDNGTTFCIMTLQLFDTWPLLRFLLTIIRLLIERNLQITSLMLLMVNIKYGYISVKPLPPDKIMFNLWPGASVRSKAIEVASE